MLLEKRASRNREAHEDRREEAPSVVREMRIRLGQPLSERTRWCKHWGSKASEEAEHHERAQPELRAG